MSNIQRVVLRTIFEILSMMILALAASCFIAEKYEVSRWIVVPCGLLYAGLSYRVMHAIVNIHARGVENWEKVGFWAQVLSLTIPIFLSFLITMYLEELCRLSRQVPKQKKSMCA